ncbi:MAG: ferritin-like domain-containing protein [Acetobacteraceae bacterium]|nr:ferritin-like domain-containing protein [Acetobacteraceae bacterium]
MASNETRETAGRARSGSNRRNLLRGAGLGAAAAAAATGLRGVGAVGLIPAAHADGYRPPDVDILNFALNLEYLEAEFYQRAVYGVGLSGADTGGLGTQGGVTGGSQVPFRTAALQQGAAEIAADELAHVRFLRSALGDAAVAEPAIDLVGSFTNAAIAAGVIQPGQTFNPFADEVSFLLGAFIFEDVGVTAYNGAAPLIHSRSYLGAAASILAVEAYHASEVRVALYALGLSEQAGKISALRAAASAAAAPEGSPAASGVPDDQGIVVNGVVNIVPTDANGLAFARTTAQVLNIVYLGGASAGFGFFPDRLNGNIR